MLWGAEAEVVVEGAAPFVIALLEKNEAGADSVRPSTGSCRLIRAAERRDLCDPDTSFFKSQDQIEDISTKSKQAEKNFPCNNPSCRRFRARAGAATSASSRTGRIRRRLGERHQMARLREHVLLIVRSVPLPKLLAELATCPSNRPNAPT